ncbi:MAG: TolC family protein [Fuerstiella sp.]
MIIAQDIVETENRINFLAGRYPQPVDRATAEFIDLELHALSAGVPSQLMQNRADIRQAERELQAAGLEVDVARAEFYPSLIIDAGVGYNAFNAKYLFSTPESLVYNIAGDLVAPVINRRAIEANYCNANAEQIQAVYNYQRTVLNAFTEVINRMSKVENYRNSLAIKREQLTALEASVDVATKLFQNARAEYVEVLLAQRDLQETKMVIIETKQQQLAATVNAYQALGGGLLSYGNSMVVADAP